jgi:DNA ligase 1
MYDTSFVRAPQPRRRHALLGLLVAGFGVLAARGALGAASAPPLMLARRYRGGVDLAAYTVSEKYDGVRGYWDGRRLWTRGGEPVAAPRWFIDSLPTQPLDGELWAGRGRFEQAVSTVRRQTPEDEAWRALRFMVFDLPARGGSFADRSAALQQLLAASGKPWLQAVPQRSVADAVALQQLLEQTVRDGGEGLMLHRRDAPYRTGRSDGLLKLKPQDDADARVLAHVPGRGKHQGMMGALQVETPEGLRFKIGTGFDDATRREPPAVGSWISFTYRGETEAGVPRFASFLRMRADLKN